MKTIYLSKSINLRFGITLSPGTPYQATYDPERSLYIIHLTQIEVMMNPKYVKKVVDN